jgi:hypothetical protein
LILNKFKVSAKVKRFPGQYGWHYVELDNTLSTNFRPLKNGRWPALLNATFKFNSLKWSSSIMPIKAGPLFIALPAKVRKAEAIEEGQNINIEINLKL